MAFPDQTRIKKPANPAFVGYVDALRCFFTLDRELTTAELKALGTQERHELARLACESEGWTLAVK